MTVIKNFALELDCVHKRGCDFEKINSEEVSGILIVAGLVHGAGQSSATMVFQDFNLAQALSIGDKGESEGYAVPQS